MGWRAVLLALCGCFSWIQPDPPPRDEWDRDPVVTCGDSYLPGVFAGLTSAGLVVAGSNRSINDAPVLDVQGLLYFVVAVAYGLDALEAVLDAHHCASYRRYRAK